MVQSISMSRLRIVVESSKDWSDFYPTSDVVSLDAYIKETRNVDRQRVINLCRRYNYQSTGYYCSLLAEARGHQVLPTVKNLGDLDRKIALLDFKIGLEDKISELSPNGKDYEFLVYFGQTNIKVLSEVAKQLFEQFGLPIFKVVFAFKKVWQIQSVQPIALNHLDDLQRTEFADALDAYSSLVWRKPKTGWSPKYMMAILVDPYEKLPPSNSAAIKKFISAAKKQGIAAQPITRKEFGKLSEFDALFIRTTTAVNHYTYQFSRSAQKAGLVVIDDPDSILSCTNKIYLAQLLETHKLPTPKTMILSKADLKKVDEIINQLDLPIVLKVPDGSFSIGVKKASSKEELTTVLKEMFQQTAFLIAQAYLYTDYDWRIGVLNNQPIYACRYYMAKNHWQIYNHASTSTKSGGFDAMPTFEVPKPVLKAAINATRRIGSGLYGVDVKQKGNDIYIIEVNDNPSIETAVEDKYLGNDLYDLIMKEFRVRLDAK